VGAGPEKSDTEGSTLGESSCIKVAEVNAIPPQTKTKKKKTVHDSKGGVNGGKKGLKGNREVFFCWGGCQLRLGLRSSSGRQRKKGGETYFNFRIKCSREEERRRDKERRGSKSRAKASQKKLEKIREMWEGGERDGGLRNVPRKFAVRSRKKDAREKYKKKAAKSAQRKKG